MTAFKYATQQLRGILFCPLTLQPFEDPVLTSQGHTYQRKAIANWLKVNKTDPLTRNQLKSTLLIQNRIIRESVKWWKEYMPQVFTIIQAKSHFQRLVEQLEGSSEFAVKTIHGKEQKKLEIKPVKTAILQIKTNYIWHAARMLQKEINPNLTELRIYSVKTLAFLQEKSKAVMVSSLQQILDLVGNQPLLKKVSFFMRQKQVIPISCVQTLMKLKEAEVEVSFQTSQKPTQGQEWVWENIGPNFKLTVSSKGFNEEVLNSPAIRYLEK